MVFKCCTIAPLYYSLYSYYYKNMFFSFENISFIFESMVYPLKKVVIPNQKWSFLYVYVINIIDNIRKQAIHI